MDKASFSIVVGKLYAYYRYSKMPTPEQISVWHDDVDFIPVVALDWIFKSLKKEDSLPRNLPKAFIACWYAYRKANPDKSITEYEYCDDCFGHGYHMFKKIEYMYNPPMPISYIARCAKCNNWKKQFGSLFETGGIGPTNNGVGCYVNPLPRVTRQQLIDNGLEYSPISDPKAKKVQGRLPKIELKEVPDIPKKYTGQRLDFEPEGWGEGAD